MLEAKMVKKSVTYGVNDSYNKTCQKIIDDTHTKPIKK